MKYIMMTKDFEGTTLYRPFIFPDEVVHADMARVVMHCEGMRGWKVRSAGFIILPLNVLGKSFDLKCGGESETLNLKAHPDDTDIIRMYEYGGKAGAFAF